MKTVNKPEKHEENKAKKMQKKTGVIRAEVSDRPLLKGHITHLINSGYR